jgi:hypothetical protein
MIVSLNEVESLTLKACRGAGMSWGLAEEAAQAARWLAARGCAWDRSLVALLARRGNHASSRLTARDMHPVAEGGALCPIHAGAAVADLLRPGEHLTLHNVLEPIWLVPFAHRRAGPVHTARLIWSDGEMESGAADARLVTIDRLDWIRIELSAAHAPATDADPAGGRSSGRPIDPSAWAALEACAARTYVAASLQSRLAGAGAGLSDND